MMLLTAFLPLFEGSLGSQRQSVSRVGKAQPFGRIFSTQDRVVPDFKELR